MSDELVRFLRKRDFRYIKEIASGGCGKTVLLFDDEAEQHFVCKKFAPDDPNLQDDLFANFINEVKLMYRVFHPNVVRIYQHHLMPSKKVGYIIMEYVEGELIDKYLTSNPEALPSIFGQTLDGFCHLEEVGILHRDIRPHNILVSSTGRIKLIDLGFGKKISKASDFQKSITLNWPASPPLEFEDGKYDWRSEVYFVGRLFQKIISDTENADERISNIVSRMCELRPSKRIANFKAAKQALDNATMQFPNFSESAIQAYREFADAFFSSIYKVDIKVKIVHSDTKLIEQLKAVYMESALETEINIRRLGAAILTGGGFFTRIPTMPIETVRNLLEALHSGTPVFRHIVLSSLAARLSSTPTFDEDEIPF